VNEAGRICVRCNIWKPLIKLMPNRRSKYGRQRLCQQCLKDHARFGGNREEVFKKYGGQCLKCGMSRSEHKEKWGRDLTIDHIDGLGRYSEKPNNNLNNLQVLCLSCHGAKDGPRGNIRLNSLGDTK
jgi:predicted HNH restriction endonuclease